MQQLFAGFPVPIPDSGGAAVQAASGSGTAATTGSNTISGLAFTPDLVILYGESEVYKFSASCYTGDLLTPWSNGSWANGQQAFYPIPAITIDDKSFTFNTYGTNVNYWWRAFKLS